MSTPFRGSMVALVTPFKANHDIDWDALEKLVQMQLDGGTQGIIACGTTAEAATMSAEEQGRVIAFIKERCQGSIPVVAGTGSSNTRVAIELSQQAKEIGVDGLLVVTPPYNKPTQDGLVSYYETISKEVSIPIILYNVPGRTQCHMLPQTVERLADNPNIVAIKEATADMNIGSEIVERCGDRVALLSGDDFTAFPLMAIGGQGWISVTANIVPADMRAMFDAWEAGDTAAARSLHYKTLPLHRSMFTQSNPIPCKKALHLMGCCEPHMRSPLLDMTDSAAITALRQSLSDYGMNLS